MPRINPKAKPFLDKIKKWKADNPKWDQQDSWKRVMNRLNTDSTRYLYKTNFPWFMTFVNLTPDEIIKMRKAHIDSDDIEDSEYFEDKVIELKRFKVDLDYGAKTIETRLSVISGFFSNFRSSYRLDVPNLFDPAESDERKAKNKRKTPPDNQEMRAIYEVAPRKHRLAFLFGYQCGLAPTDTVKLSWSNLNIDFETEERDFIPFDHSRNKSSEIGSIVLNPDLLHLLKNEWIDQGRPDEGYIFNFRGDKIHERHPNEWLRESANKALGEKRGKQIKFKDLRDSFNDVVKSDDDLKQEIADRLMGHSPKGSRGDYYISPATIVSAYRQVFTKLTVNGWRYKQKASQVEELEKRVTELEEKNSELEYYKQRLQNIERMLEIDEELVTNPDFEEAGDKIRKNR